MTPRPPASASDAPAPAAADFPPTTGDNPGVSVAEHTVGPARHYLIAARGAVNRLRPAEFDTLAIQENQGIASALQSGASGIRLIARLSGPQSPAVSGDATLPNAQDTIFLAELSDNQVQNFRQNFRQAIVAEDVPVDMAAPATGGIVVPDPGLLPLMPLDDVVDLTLTIRSNGSPLSGANVYLMGSIFPAQGVSDANGQVSLRLYGERPETLKALYVKPSANCWSLWVPRPSLRQGQNNVVDLLPLSAQYPGFPGQPAWGWGQVAMGLDRYVRQYGTVRGQGVKVAVVDSGVQKTHPNVSVPFGRDLVSSNNAWGDDSVGHGTHCAGVIAARDTGSGVRGFAPDAELHAVKIFPGAQISHLVEALNYCIEHGIDVVNMSLGIPQLGPDQIELLQGKIRQARAHGVACVVAAGNSAGPVQFPAVFPEVLAVGAIGQQGTFPASSYHATQVYNDAPPAANALFSAKFSCFGPEVDVAAPGVAVLSTFIPNGYAAMDGTSMAAPHVAGLAALVVGHHPDLRGQQRNESRVGQLFEILKRGSKKIATPDQRQGAGMPDVAAVLAGTGGGQPTGTAGSQVPAATGQPASTSGSQQHSSGPSEGDLARDFPMFGGLRPSQTGTPSPQALQAALAELAQLERQLRQRQGAGLATASTNGPGGHGSPAASPALQELDAAMRALGLLQPASAHVPSTDRDLRLQDLDRAMALAGLSAPTPAASPGPAGHAGSVGLPGSGLAPASYEPSRGDAELQFLDSFLRDQVEDLIAQLRRYVHQYSTLGACVPLVNQTVAQFGAREYARALTTGYQALSCIRSRLT